MKLITINIEDEKHLMRVLPFIESERPDVLCLQEVCEKDLTLFEKLGYKGEFIPMNIIPTKNEDAVLGTALLSIFPIDAVCTYCYYGSENTIVEFDGNNVTSTQKKALIHADVHINDDIFTIATTHFTWTPHGPTPNQPQLESMEKFIPYISTMKPHVMCGDFNIPRNLNPLYQELCKHYTDTIPPSYVSSLDRTLHKIGNHPDKQILFDAYMVDYVFTQPPYTASDVRLQFGLSDHAGVVATITKN